MFDPTVFDNLKTVLEGAVYDHDLNGEIEVSGRRDQVDMAAMSRTFRIEFRLRERGEATAAIQLHADAADLSAEILEQVSVKPGCRLEIRLASVCRGDVNVFCDKLHGSLNEIWGSRPNVRLFCNREVKPSALPETLPWRLTVKMDFGRKIHEEQIEDLPALLERSIASLRRLEQMAAGDGS